MPSQLRYSVRFSPIRSSRWPGHRAAELVFVRAGIPVVPALALPDRIVCQHHEPVPDQVQVQKLISWVNAGRGVVSARRNNAGERSSVARGDVKIARDPEVRAALEHHILDPITLAFRDFGGDASQGIAFGEAPEHSRNFFAHESVATV